MEDTGFAFNFVSLLTIFRNIFFTPVIPTTAVFFNSTFDFLPDSLKAETASLPAKAPVTSTISKMSFFPD